jgi:3-dehydro-L-gulonate 2-dehydrogenase
MSAIVHIEFDRMEREFFRVLDKLGFPPEKANACSRIFAENSLDGVYTHGVNRFARFVKYVSDGHIHIQAEPTRLHSAGSVEQWDGHLGPGPLNALICTRRAVELAKKSGIGCVGLRNTNHWMRGGTYAREAAKAGCMFIGWTNTIANMPAWGAVDCRLGNNPFVLGLHYKDDAIVLDMAMSQFSYGTMEAHKLREKKLPVPGGYDLGGNLTADPSAILESKRSLPIGYWKGSGLALLLDIFAATIAGGLSTAEISKGGVENALSQIFIALDMSQLSNNTMIAETVNSIIDDYHSSDLAKSSSEIIYPGERVIHVRNENLKNGIPVDQSIWDEILDL